AALPERLLSHPNGSALAVIGHVERATGFSIQRPGASPHVDAFRTMVKRILAGEPVGYAMKELSDRFATASVRLTQLQQLAHDGQAVDPTDIGTTWIERNDAKNYVVLGDPY